VPALPNEQARLDGATVVRNLQRAIEPHEMIGLQRNLEPAPSRDELNFQARLQPHGPRLHDPEMGSRTFAEFIGKSDQSSRSVLMKLESRACIRGTLPKTFMGRTLLYLPQEGVLFFHSIRARHKTSRATRSGDSRLSLF